MRHVRPKTSASRPAGYSLIELVFVFGLIATMAAAATPNILAGLDEFQMLGAVRYMASRLQQARMEAVSRTANVGMRFTSDAASVVYAVYQDGNNNGLSTHDIDDGDDPQIQPPEHLEDNFAGVTFGTLPGLPAVDASSTPPGDDPIRLGSGNMASFTALGTSTSGTLYLRGRSNTQYAIRIFGETSRIRILRFDWRSYQWISQ